MEENKKCQFLYGLDLFGKTPEIYFQGKSKKPTELGVTLTIIYIIIYITFFIYKLVRMVKRMDVTFYDTYAYKDFPYINITNEEFYGAFSMGYMIDEHLYYPKGKFVYEVKTQNGYVIEKEEELVIETCDINKFGSRYKELFKDKGVEQLYCINKINGTLEGYSNLERFSYVNMKFYPCVNQTRNGEPCYPDYIVKEFFTKNILEFKMQDNLLSPEIYDKPVEALEKDLNTPVFIDLYQLIYSYIQIIILETDDDITGLNFWADSKVEKYPKYDETFLIASPQHDDIIKSGGPVADVTLQLAAKVITTKRKYMTLLDVLGDVGGLMEILYSFFNLITSFLTEISYDKSLINSLFNFDINKKQIIIKRTIKRNNQLQKNEKINSFYVEKYNESHIEKNENEKVDINKNSLNLDTNKNPQNEGENDKKGSNENPNVKTSKRYLKKKSKKKDSYNDNHDKEENERSNRPIVDKRLNEINALKNDKVEIYLRHEENTKDNIIKAIKMNSCFYCCLSKKKSIDEN